MDISICLIFVAITTNNIHIHAFSYPQQIQSLPFLSSLSLKVPTPSIFRPQRQQRQSLNLSKISQQQKDEDTHQITTAADVTSIDGNGKDEKENSSKIQLQYGTLYDNDFDDIIMKRYACTRFQRYDDEGKTSIKLLDTDNSTAFATFTSSKSNITTVQKAIHCLNLSRRSPSGFNVQPYKCLIVYEQKHKDLLSRYCLGRNANRIQDSDCTVLFLSDRECLRTMTSYSNLVGRRKNNNTSSEPDSRRRKRLSSSLLKLKLIIALFSSGYPIPRILAAPLSFLVRSAISIASAILNALPYKLFMYISKKKHYIDDLAPQPFLLPSLSNGETWAVKNTMLVAMTYMLSCTSHGLATSPMEGYYAPGIKQALKIPRRYSIPLIVSTGLPYRRQGKEEDMKQDDVGMTHASPCDDNASSNATPRYPINDMIYCNTFGSLLPNLNC